MFLAMLLLVAPALYHSDVHDQWTRTFQVSQTPDLVVRTSDANIRVDTWNQSTVEATVSTDGYAIGNGGITVDANQMGNTIQLDVRFPREYFHVDFHHRSVDIVFHVPRTLSLNLHTGDGAIEVNGVAGQMTLRSGDGSISVNGVEGQLQATAGDGRVRVRGRFDQLNLKTGDGSIEADVLDGSTMSSDWSVHTGDGHLTLRVPAAFSADVDIHSSDGHIDLGMPVAVSGRTESHDIHGRLNQGGRLLTLHAGDGSIRLEKL
ncbi:MAG TPA: DUF4097 family beta strand repeat-containing protein [Blastocatellia bacterium]